MSSLQIELRADTPAYAVAAQLAARLGFRMRRTVKRLNLLERPMSGEPSKTVTVRVSDRRWDPSRVNISQGYGTELQVAVPAYHRSDRLAEVSALFDEVCREFGYPALLRDDVLLLAAWSPALGRRDFPAETFVIADDERRWAEYALPPVTAPIAVAPEDVLGQLYARIVAEPDDDGLRLAYADAVEPEHPDYARLIRLQVRYTLDRQAGVAWSPVRLREMNQLERQYHTEVVPPEVWGPIGKDWHVRRGFVEAVAMKASWFIEDAGLFVAHVPLRMLYLTGEADERIDELAALPELARLRGLSFWGNPIGDDGLHRVLASPYLTGLRWLSLDNTGVTLAGIEELAASDALPELRYLRADRNLRLNALPGYDYDGTLVSVDKPYRAMELAERYDRAWLRWQPSGVDEQVFDPEYAEV
ncbi:TIGR02996 domain-containing protein [Rugosimonospora africana]|uniref:Uncharacterized protein n=1 Tax=Rugosimonospora africana TaxID=556532 RepID=A0A8J3QR03_9ACTN|nr:TIGR02996 domain-containing protein [Rugosimonospora africana]GIH14075.1 hypothetical protein Raf01_22470 [Rugosimonospora africana]